MLTYLVNVYPNQRILNKYLYFINLRKGRKKTILFSCFVNVIFEKSSTIVTSFNCRCYFLINGLSHVNNNKMKITKQINAAILV